MEAISEFARRGIGQLPSFVDSPAGRVLVGARVNGPQALATLMDGEFFAKAAPSVRVRYRKIQGAFASSLEGMSFHGLDLLAEDLQDA